MRFVFLISIVAFSRLSIAQTEDNQWIFGTSSKNGVFSGYLFGNTILDFSVEPPLIYFDNNVTLDMHGTDASICDNHGSILLYTNGMSLYNSFHHPIPGSDSLAYGEFWERYNIKDYPIEGEDWVSGYSLIQHAVILPWPEEEGNYAVFYDKIFIELINGEEFAKVNQFMFSKIKINESNLNGITLIKDKIIQETDFNFPKFTTCRHANGSDWWLIQSTENEDRKFIYLFNKDGIHLKNTLIQPPTINSAGKHILALMVISM